MASYTIATPYPGTPLYYQVKEKGYLKDTDFDHYDTATPTFETPTMTIQELRKLRAKAWSSFYERPSYIRAMFKKSFIYGLAAMKAAVTFRLIDLEWHCNQTRYRPSHRQKATSKPQEYQRRNDASISCILALEESFSGHTLHSG